MPLAPARSFACALSASLMCAIASCVAAEPPASTAAPTTPLAAPRVDPKAQAIVERGLAVLTRLKSLDLTVRLALEGPDAAEQSTGMESPARWLFDFGRDAKPSAGGMPFARVVVDSLKDSTVVRRVTFDGTRARSMSEAERTFMQGTLQEVSDPTSAMPGWFMDNRVGMAPVGGGPEDMGAPPLTEATIVGEETLDGTPCDVVRTLRVRMLSGPPSGDGQPAAPQALRIIETTAYARIDGLPRRTRLAIETDAAPSDGMSSVATFTHITIDPPLNDAMFATDAPAGFTKKDPPKRMQRGAALAVKAGDAAPAFALKDTNGHEVTLASLKGRVVLLDFWASWCGPCKAAMPAIQKIHDDYRAKSVAVFGVNVGERKPDAGTSYFADKGYTYGCLLAGEELSNAYGISGIPTLVVIGKDGRVRRIDTGFGADGDAQLREAIDKALAE